MLEIPLKVSDLFKYRHIASAVEALPQIGYRVQSVYRKQVPEDLRVFVTRNSEIYAGGTSYKTRVVYSLLYGELTDKANLTALIADGVDSFDTETLKSMIKSKEDGEKVAFALSVLQDYLDYLKTDTWRGLKSNFKFEDDFEVFSGIKSKLGISDIDLGRNTDVFSVAGKETIQALSELSKDFLVYELLLMSEELKRRGGSK